MLAVEVLYCLVAGLDLDSIIILVVVIVVIFGSIFIVICLSICVVCVVHGSCLEHWHRKV